MHPTKCITILGYKLTGILSGCFSLTASASAFLTSITRITGRYYAQELHRTSYQMVFLLYIATSSSKLRLLSYTNTLYRSDKGQLRHNCIPRDRILNKALYVDFAADQVGTMSFRGRGRGRGMGRGGGRGRGGGFTPQRDQGPPETVVGTHVCASHKARSPRTKHFYLLHFKNWVMLFILVKMT